jgi:hypothetical protein
VLTRLSHQQVIILRANHRPRVAAPDVEQTRQTLHARRLTEMTLVRLACQRPLPEQLKRLHALVDSERHCIARGPTIRLSGTFHLQLAEMAGNAPLAHFLGSLVPLTSLAIAQFDTQLEGYCGWQVHGTSWTPLSARTPGSRVLLSQYLDHLEAALLNPQPISARIVLPVRHREQAGSQISRGAPARDSDIRLTEHGSPYCAATFANPSRIFSSGKSSAINTITLSRASPSAHSVSQSKP